MILVVILVKVMVLVVNREVYAESTPYTLQVHFIIISLVSIHYCIVHTGYHAQFCWCKIILTYLHYCFCAACDCDVQGSMSSQCDRRTGQCQCAPGVTGAKCDRCARGTTGSLPHCVPCGECFDNWDTIISELRSKFSFISK